MATNLTPAERTAFAEYFRVADTQDLGVLTGEIAVGFFEKSGLPPVVLGEIWGIADESNDGFLPPARFNVAARLIGHAQRGEPVSEALVSKPGNVPYFAGVSVAGVPASQLNQKKGAASAAPVAPAPAPAAVVSPQPTGAGLAHLKPADRARFLGMFTNAGPEPSTGLLAGEKARDIFLKSKLPFDTLGQIWNLADTQGRGALDGTDFAIGMHLIQQTMAGNIRPPLPPSLPPGLYEEASGRSAPVATPPRSASSIIPRQATGVPAVVSSPLRQQTTGAFGRAQAPWAVSAAEKTSFDGFFDGLDTTRQGTIDGSKAVPFFMDSGLPESTLAQVWDLADIKKNGQLDKDEFAVAMKLIHDKLAGKEVPAVLPAEFVPPSLRNLASAVSPASPTSASFAPPAASETQRDLFSLLDDDEPEAATPVQPMKTGASAAGPSPFALAAAPARSFSPALSQSAARPSTASSLPRGLASPKPSAAPTQIPQRTGDDAAIEVGNLHAQLASTQSSVSSLQKQRTELDTSVASSASQLSSLQTQLAAARAAHSTETSMLESLRSRAKTHADDLKTTRESLITAESDLSALRVERAELEGQLLRDKEEARALKEKLKQVTLETEKLKTETEAARKEVRQNKGLGAISRKQVERAEEVRDRAKVELEEAKKEATAAPSVTSPAGSVRSLNPFDRMRGPSPSQGSSLATGATVGAGVAGAAGLAAAVAHHEHAAPEVINAAQTASPVSQKFPELDSVGAALPATTQAQPKDDFEDAFGPPSTVATSSAPIAAAAPAEDSFKSSFDDAFGDSPAPAAAPTHAPAATETFDDAFGADDAPIAAPTQTALAASTRDAESSDDEDEGPEDADAHHRGTSGGGMEPSPFGAEDDDHLQRESTPIVPGAMPESPVSIGNEHFSDAHQVQPTPPAPSREFASHGANSKEASTATTEPFVDDFDKEFEDLTPAPVTTSAPGAPIKTSSGGVGGEEDDLDAAFDREFNESFASAPSAPNGSSAFDDAFKDFDHQQQQSTSSNKLGGGISPPPGYRSQPGSSSSAAPTAPATNGFGFDNSFGSLGAGNTTGARPSAGERKPSGAQADDMPAVAQVCALGFSRTQAITALEKSGYDVSKAINSLLDAK